MQIIIIISNQYANSQINWDNKYSVGYDNSSSERIFENRDTTYFISNYVQDSTRTFQDINFLKLSKIGTQLISKTFRLPQKFLSQNGGRRQLIQFSNVTCVLPTGFQFDNYKYGLKLIKLNSQTLDTIFSKTYNPDWFVGPYMNNFYKLGENKYVFTGNNFLITDTNKYTGPSWPTVWHLDTNLNITYKKNVINPNGMYPFHSATNLSNKIIAMIGSSPYTNPFNGKMPYTILEYDSMGTAIRAVELNTDSGYFNIGRIVYCEPDTSYLLLCIKSKKLYNGASLQKCQLGLIKLNAKTLMPKWAYSYQIPNVEDYGNIGFSDATIEKNGDIVNCGFYNPNGYTSGEDYRGIIMRVDKDGNFIWARDYNNFNSTQSMGSFNLGRVQEMFNSIIKVKDKGYILGGSTIWLPKSKAWVVKTDSMGCASSACPSFTFVKQPFVVLQHTLSLANGTTGVEYNVSIKENEEKSYQIGIYPNPFNEKLVVEIINKDGLEFRLSNLLGEEIKFGKLNLFENTIYTSELKQGVYFLKIFDGYNQVAIRKVIKTGP